jgi:hypothetical protein
MKTALFAIAISQVLSTPPQLPVTRGSIVLIADSADRLTAKVIVAAPGDLVELRVGRVSVNGMRSNITLAGVVDWGPRLLGTGEYFVAGNPLQVATMPEEWGLIGPGAILGLVQPRLR